MMSACFSLMNRMMSYMACTFMNSRRLVLSQNVPETNLYIIYKEHPLLAVKYITSTKKDFIRGIICNEN